MTTIISGPRRPGGGTTQVPPIAPATHRPPRAAHPSSFVPPDEPVSVDGVTIPAEEIVREMQHHTAERPEIAWHEAAASLVVRHLLLAEARRLSIEAAPASLGEGRCESEEEALVRQLVEREVRTPAPTEEECWRYYNANLTRFRSADLAEVSHILLLVRPGDADPMAAARRIAGKLAQILTARPEDFARLARAYSECPSASVGGSLGQIGPGDTTPEFEAALARLLPGEITREPVESRFGLHIIRLERRLEGRLLDFAVAEQRIAAYLAERSRRTAVAQYLARLAGSAEITGIELATPADMRVS